MDPERQESLWERVERGDTDAWDEYMSGVEVDLMAERGFDLIPFPDDPSYWYDDEED